MKILFDQGTPAPLRHHLPGHAIDTVFEQGWDTLSNGNLLNVAEVSGYRLLITTDQNLHHQQNLEGRQLAILVLLSTSWPRIQLRLDEIRTVVDAMTSGEYREVSV